MNNLIGNYNFFLGGSDAEMDAIRQILKEKKLVVHDKNLSWGAKASTYKSEIEKLLADKIPVLIELDVDIDLPRNAIIVDHHNEKSGRDKKTSIEQVADLLNIQLNRKQQLISANDKAFIDGMLGLNATQPEIDETRKLDRKCQGVTEEDEKLGKISISHFLDKLDEDTVFIQSLTDKTTVITDSIYRYYRHIFIITPNKKFIYSGTGQLVEKLKHKFAELKNNDNRIEFWFGGNLPDKGFFGSNTSLKKNEIKELCNIMSDKRIHSQHIFLFPFTIQSDELDNKVPAQEKLKTIHNHLEGSSWKYKPFKIAIDNSNPRKVPYSDDEIWAYNEYNYFHEFIHDTLYTKQEKDAIFTNKDHTHPISLYYERETFPGDEITYFIQADESIHYTLKVDHVSLRIFETGVGILSITLYNICYKNFDDISRINDFGRRIYPQFLGLQTDKYPLIDATKRAFFADKIVFNACSLKITQEFKTEDFFSKSNQYTNYLQELLQPLHSKENGKKSDYICKSIIDDRMFTLCWHENDDLIKILKEKNHNGYVYENHDKWYQYIFLDGNGPLVAHKSFMNKLIKHSTYARFTEWGTLFGITRYSFMCLCGIDTFSDFPYKQIRNHMQKVYYQMSVLLLAQRASIIQFNNELEKISLELTDTKTKEKNSKTTEDDSNYKYLLGKVEKLENLDMRIINFLNRMTYEEITPQEQGIELYQIALDNMQIPKQISSLKQRIADLHLTADQILERINLDEEKKRTEIQRERKKLFDKITLIAAIFAPLTLYSTLARYIKPFIILPDYLNYGIIPEIFFPLWSIIFLLTLFILFYCLINDDYSVEYGYKPNWFSPLKALTQQFIIPNKKSELFWKKISLIVLVFLLFFLSLPTLINLVSKILFYLRFTWQLL